MALCVRLFVPRVSENTQYSKKKTDLELKKEEEKEIHLPTAHKSRDHVNTLPFSLFRTHTNTLYIGKIISFIRRKRINYILNRILAALLRVPHFVLLNGYFLHSLSFSSVGDLPDLPEDW